MRDPKHRESSVPEIEPWEMALVKMTARRIRTTERDDLESELAVHLMRLKRNPSPVIQDWKALVKKALRNKAINWIRDRQAAEKRMTTLDASREEVSGETFVLQGVLRSPEPDHHLRIALGRALEELDPELRVLWDLLVQENGNQGKVAKRMGKHRNTVRHWIRSIRQVLKRHGF